MQETPHQRIEQGLALQQAGRFNEAGEIYNQLIDSNPELADAWHLRGVIALQCRQANNALRYVERAIALKGFYLYFNTLSLILRELGRLDDALDAANEALAQNTQFAEAHYNRGIIFTDLEKYQAAMHAYRRAIEVEPGHIQAHSNLGNLLRNQKQPELAIEEYDKAIASNPNFSLAYNNKGSALEDLERYEDARQCYHQALKLNPKFTQAYYNLGTVLKQLGHMQESEAALKQALHLNAKHPEAHHNLAEVLKSQGRLQEALTHVMRAMTLKDDYWDAIDCRGMMLLALGEFAQGWQDYEARFYKCNPIERLPLENIPHWQGESLQGKILYVYGEQGVGDEVMFATGFNELIGKCKQLIVSCDKRFLALFSRSFPKAQFINRRTVNPPSLAAVDVQIAAGSTLQYLRPTADNFPKQKQLLTPLPEHVNEWQKRYDQLGPGLKVGIAWRGGTEDWLIAMRTTALKQWFPVFNTPNCHFINCQYGAVANDLNGLQEDYGIAVHSWPDADPLLDLDFFSAQLQALDLVISVDNSTVHLAGAVGTTTFALLNYIPEWRWLLDRDDTLWYDSVRLFRQPKHQDWDSVFHRVAEALTHLGKN